MQVGDSFKAILNGIEFYQRHVFLIRIAENLNCLNFSILTEDFIEGIFTANLFLQRAYMESLGGRIYG